MRSLKTILITGGTGLLALNWACAVRDKWHVILGTHLHSVKLNGVRSQKLNLDQAEEFGRQLDVLLPDLVVHTAGLTNIEACELHPTLAHQANVLIAKNVAMATATRNIPLIHISTDHLFSGDSSFYIEEDPVCPLNNYAKTKLEAEQVVSALHPTALIIRTNFFGWGHAKRISFTDWIINNLLGKQPLMLFDDVYFTPILADNLVSIAHDLSEKKMCGIFHVCGDQRISKYHFALEVCKEFALLETDIQPGKFISSKLTMRPRDMSLNNSKAQQAVGFELGKVNEFLAGLRAQELNGRRQELLESIT
jgi:dTDP-4-dehydrorhamnose reductase